MTNFYRQGARAELAFKRELEALGWFVIRSAGSKGPADLVALKAGQAPRLYQVKVSRDGKPHTLLPSERLRFRDAAQQAGALAWVVTRMRGKNEVEEIDQYIEPGKVFQ